MLAPGQRLVRLLPGAGSTPAGRTIRAATCSACGGISCTSRRRCCSARPASRMIERQKRAAAVLAVLLNAPAALRAQTGSSPANEHWVTTWATAQQLAPTRLPFGGRGELAPPPPAARVPATLKDQTVRMIAHASMGGRRVRVRLANALEKPTLRVGAAHIALRATGAAIVPASDRALTFGGRPSTVVPPGDDGGERSGGSRRCRRWRIWPCRCICRRRPGCRRSIPTACTRPTSRRATRPASATLKAERDDDGVSLAVGRRRAGAGRRAGAIVTFGDSITDGVGATLDSDRAWPSLLAAKLASGGLAAARASSTSGCREIACCGRASA